VCTGDPKETEILRPSQSALARGSVSRANYPRASAVSRNLSFSFPPSSLSATRRRRSLASQSELSAVQARASFSTRHAPELHGSQFHGLEEFLRAAPCPRVFGASFRDGMTRMTRTSSSCFRQTIDRLVSLHIWIRRFSQP